VGTERSGHDMKKNKDGAEKLAYSRVWKGEVRDTTFALGEKGVIDKKKKRKEFLRAVNMRRHGEAMPRGQGGKKDEKAGPNRN